MDSISSQVMPLKFRREDKHLWNTVDVLPPAGDILVSDGFDTWVVTRLNPSKPFGKNTRVKFWRAIFE
ncbi:MAG: hypothetical protein KGN01_05550 [Patescibacteria group bacterium]|nr:hypothetical protein [Patescibacteria group bacterium]